MAATERIVEPRSWLDLARDWTSAVELPELRLPEFARGDGVVSSSALALVLMAQAYVAWVLGGVGMLARAGLSWASYGALLAQQLLAIALELGLDSGRRGTAIRTLLDESAAQLRELGDLSVQEARTLQRNLQKLADQLRDLDGESLEQPHRFGKVKR
jgi:hypothetical protein